MFHSAPPTANSVGKLPEKDKFHLSKIVQQNCLILVDEDHNYINPVKLIKTPADMQLWEKSEAYLVCFPVKEYFLHDNIKITCRNTWALSWR